MNRLNYLLIISTFLIFSINITVSAQDGGDDGVVTTAGTSDGSVWDGGSVDGGIDGGGFVTGCTDQFASNYNPSATVWDGTCTYTDCSAFQNSALIQQSNPLYACYSYAISGGTCEEILNMGGELCALVISCGYCQDDTGCSDNQWECANGECINASWFCDGSESNGNASWGPDCSDGSDENLEACCEAESSAYDVSICDPCEDNDNDGICDENDDCVGELDDCGVCNGNGPSEECWNDEIVCDLDDCDEQPVTFEITLDLTYPSDNEHIEDYTDVDIRWDYEGTATNDVYVTVYFAYEYGGGFKTVARNILLDDGETNVDLTTDATGQSLCNDDDPSCIETIHGKIKVSASDGIEGNITISESESIIVGEPEGDISINWLNQDDDMLSIDWAWINDQSIIIQKDAFSSLANYSRLRIYDNDGIYDNSCTNAGLTSNIQLLTISISNGMEGQTYKIDCGVDHCSEGGQRIEGYVEGNQIYFYATEASTGQDVQVYPVTSNNLSAFFDNASVVIEDFSLTDTSNGNNSGGGEDGGSNSEDCYDPTVNSDDFILLGEYNNNNYYYSTQRERWDDAQHICEDNGGNLASITSEDENDAIISLLQDLLGDTNSNHSTAWIGYYISEGNNNFEWVSGDSASYTNWAPEEPNYSEEDLYVEIYLPIYNNENELWGKWNNIDNHRRQFILEIEECITDSNNLECYYYTNADECTNDSTCWWTNDCGDQMLCMPYGVESDCGRDRDFDGFSIYNKITSIRDCNLVEGCTDDTAINFDETANELDCSCYYDADDGCMDITALNFNPTATSDIGSSCLYGTCIVGCMDDTACNYDLTSIVENNGCLYGNDCLSGCVDDGLCTVATCGYDSPQPGTSACNFDGTLADGWIDDGSCGYTIDDMSNDNHGWCPLETLTNVTTNVYNDRIPAMQTNSNLKYRVWLLDDFQNEVLKTFESSGVSVTVCEELDCNEEFGGSAYYDDCGECITEETICDDCSIIPGDIDGSGTVDVVDVVLLVNIVLSSSELDSATFCAADFNGDGLVNVVDIVNLVTFVLG